MRYRSPFAVGSVALAIALAACKSGDIGEGNTTTGTTGGTGGSAPVCQDRRTFFALDIWPIMASKCTSCHAPGGEASTGDNPKGKTAGFILQWETYPDFLDENITQLERMVTEQLGNDPKLLIKPLGGDTHVGGALFDSMSPEYQKLKQFVEMTKDPALQCTPTDAGLLSKVPVKSWDETFRMAALTLAGRLPTDKETGIADEKTFDTRLGALLKEEGYITRAKTFFNDLLLVESGTAVQVGCFQFPAKEYPAAKECQDGVNKHCTGLTGTALTTCQNTYNAKWNGVRRALAEEPLALLANVLRKGAPFTEVLTADYAMVNPYSAVLYGLDAKFPAPTPANYSQWKEEKVTAAVAGAYPHAGVLSTPGFLGRWVSTATNRDRGRSRVVYDAFLATNILTLAQRLVDTSALTAVANAPRNAPACSACHSTVDPIANAFSAFPDGASIDFDPNMTAATNRHQEMLPPGFAAEAMPGQEKNMLAWATDKITQDPRFSLSVTRMFFKGITGRTPLLYPKDATAADLADRFAAWDAEDTFLHDVAKKFEDAKYDPNVIVLAVVKSAFFRGGAIPAGFNATLASELGDGRLLTPEILSDKLRATLGTHWGSWTNTGDRKELLLTDDKIFYGGIDSLSVTQRLTDPSSLSASVSARMANEMACRTVAWDFTKAAKDRLLFPLVERTSAPATDEPAIRKNIVYLIERLTGIQEKPDSAEVTAAFTLFKDTHAALLMNGDKNLLESCKGKWDRATPVGQNCNPDCTSYADTPLPANEQITDDPDFTLRSWMAVVTYLLSDYRFLYQ
jgi:hypothetical protein